MSAAPDIQPAPPPAEEAIIGSLLLGARYADVAAIVSPEDFTSPALRLIFAVIAELPDGSADVLTVEQRLRERGQLQAAGGVARLSELARTTPSRDNAQAYAEIVRRHAVCRRLQELLEENPDTAELAERLAAEAARLNTGAEPLLTPLELSPVSSWADKPEPPPRSWIWENFIPAGRVTSFGGDGGHGKTTIALQIGVHHAIGRALYGRAMKAGKVLGIFCEDEQDELERRVRAACTAENVDLTAVSNFVALSRDGHQNMLCTFERDLMVLTPFYHQLETTIASFRPSTLILDVTADFFAGDFMSTPHVRQFIKVGLGAWCVRYDLAVLLLSHPSATGLNSGEGDGFSRAWNNTVRSRFFLRKPKTDKVEDSVDRRLLEVKKSNYGPSGITLPLVWQAGVFVPDPEPIGDSRGDDRRRSAQRGGTRLAIAVLQYLRDQERNGVITVKYGAITDHLVKTGALPSDAGEDGIRLLAKYEANRKQVSRALDALRADNIVQPCAAPRGSYRLVPRYSCDPGEHP